MQLYDLRAQLPSYPVSAMPLCRLRVLAMLKLALPEAAALQTLENQPSSACSLTEIARQQMVKVGCLNKGGFAVCTVTWK